MSEIISSAEFNSEIVSFHDKIKNTFQTDTYPLPSSLDLIKLSEIHYTTCFLMKHNYHKWRPDTQKSVRVYVFEHGLIYKNNGTNHIHGYWFKDMSNITTTENEVSFTYGGETIKFIPDPKCVGTSLHNLQIQIKQYRNNHNNVAVMNKRNVININNKAGRNIQLIGGRKRRTHKRNTRNKRKTKSKRKHA